jgi:hypothetical protein
VPHAARPSVRKDRGPFLFARGYARLLPLIASRDAIGGFFSPLSMVPSRGTLLAESAYHTLPADVPLGGKAADRCLYTLAQLRSTESRAEPTFTRDSADCSLGQYVDCKK